MTPSDVARSIIDELDIRHQSEIHIEDIANYRNAFVNYDNISGAEARLVRLKDHGIITVNKQKRNHARVRFSIAHELGHFELHKDVGHLFSCTSDDMICSIKNNKEYEANIFSAELLMPKMLFSPLCIMKSPEISLIRSLAETFRVSITAAALRYIEVSREPCALFYCKNNIIEWAKKSSDFDYYIKSRGNRVDDESFVWDVFQGKNIPERGEEIAASAWITDYRVDPDALIYESIFNLSFYNATLSLIWVNKDIER